MVQTEKGVQSIFRKYHITVFTTFSHEKRGIVESFNCTIKGIMFINYLQQITTEDISTSSMKSVTGITIISLKHQYEADKSKQGK